MALKDELLELDRGFWTGGEDHFLAHVDTRCALVFAQMQGDYSREEVAASARDPDRWRDLRISAAFLVEPSADIAFLSYDASVVRKDGAPYRALIGSSYIRRDKGWKLFAHQHTPVESE